MSIEHHPLEPFLPADAQYLFLGSFPPPCNRWSMNFFYPNYQNDMWRIMGYIFYNDKNYFCDLKSKKFDKNKIVDFCNKTRLAFYDTAISVNRLKGNASDKFLQILEFTNIPLLLAKLPKCNTVIVTGEKAAENFAAVMDCQVPKIGSGIEFVMPQNNKILKLYRIPSTSRAYPLSIEKKAEYLKTIFRSKEVR